MKGARVVATYGVCTARLFIEAGENIAHSERPITAIEIAVLANKDLYTLVLRSRAVD